MTSERVTAIKTTIHVKFLFKKDFLFEPSKTFDDQNLFSWTAQFINGSNNWVDLKVIGTFGNEVGIGMSSLYKLTADLCKDILSKDSAYDCSKKSWFFESICSRSNLSSGSLWDTEFTLNFEVDVLIPCKELDLSDRIETMFSKGTHNDAILVCEGKKFRVHKGVLAEVSPTFADLFKKENQKDKRESLEVKDVPLDAMKELLIYIYSGTIPSLDNVADLYLAAEKYKIEDLKEKCLKLFPGNLNNTTVLSSLKISFLVNNEEFKQKSLNYIKKNVNDVRCVVELLTSNCWAEIARDYPQLAAEVVSAIHAKEVIQKE
jgi:hypothetical protein